MVIIDSRFVDSNLALVATIGTSTSNIRRSSSCVYSRIAMLLFPVFQNKFDDVFDIFFGFNGNSDEPCEDCIELLSRCLTEDALRPLDRMKNGMCFMKTRCDYGCDSVILKKTYNRQRH